MAKELIAYVMPANIDDPDNTVPLLVYNVDTLPVVEDLHFTVFMLGLIEGEPYWLSAQLSLDGEPMHEEAGVWVRAKLKYGNPDDVAASINMHLDRCKFEKAGNYRIQVKLLKNNQVIHQNEAYFRVSME